jgi:NAD(P)-dependent dehydrogenase (short-subunit alcohol dehydrogenase family)
MYAKNGIRANAICPGSIETEIGTSMGNVNPTGAQIAMGGLGLNPRVGAASEVAAAALFLASDDASFVNGTTLSVDGGWTAY